MHVFSPPDFGSFGGAGLEFQLVSPPGRLQPKWLFHLPIDPRITLLP